MTQSEKDRKEILEQRKELAAVVENERAAHQKMQQAISSIYEQWPDLANEEEVQHDKEEDDARCLGLDTDIN